MDLFFQLLGNGIALGGVYALFGISFGLIYNTAKVVHFAHGATLAVGAYAIYTFHVPLGLPMWAAVLLAGVPMVLTGLAAELLVYRPMRRRGAPTLLVLVASFGVFTIFQNLFVLIWGGVNRSVTTGVAPPVFIGPVLLTRVEVARMVLGLTATLVLLGYLYRTRLGMATRAVVNSPRMSSIVGIDTDRVLLWSYAGGSLLLLPAAWVEVLQKGAHPDLGMLPLLMAAVAVFVGGYGVIPAAAVGGLFVGVLEAMSLLVLPSQWKSTVAFGVLILFLVLKPSGLLGVRVRDV